MNLTKCHKQAIVPNALTPLTTSQRIALEWHLSDYDRSRTFEYILDDVYNDRDTVTVWEPLSGQPGFQVAEWIECLESVVADAVKEATL